MSGVRKARSSKPKKPNDGVLVRRLATRGRPNAAMRKSMLETTVVDVYVARDPQGVKLFKSEPKMSSVGTWAGAMVRGYEAMEPKVFMAMFRNAKTPDRGTCVAVKMVV